MLERKGETIGPHDLQIAAMALRHDLRLARHKYARVFERPGTPVRDWGIMDVRSLDLTTLSKDNLIALNQRIVERLQLLRSAKSLAKLVMFTVRLIVEFEAEDGRTINGTNRG